MPHKAVTTIATTAQEKWDVAKRDRQHHKIKNERAKKARIVNASRKALEKLQDKNLEEYFNMNLTQKLEFAERGYRFARSPGLTAVTIGQTCIRMNNGRDRGIFCGEAFPYLPDNFVLTFRVTRTTMIEPTGPERQYMVEAPGIGEPRPIIY